MMKSPLILACVATLTVSAAALAATGDFAKIDANADGKITLEEGMLLHPTWTAESFKALDVDADGAMNQQEYDTAIAAMATEAPVVADPATAAPAVQEAKTMRKDGPASYLDVVGPNEVLASTLIGMRIYAVESDVDDTKTYPADSRKDWSDVGEVNDVVLDWDGSIKAVVLGVGGFLGVGEKDVAIEMSSLRRVRESSDSKDWFLVVNSSKDLLLNAPAYAGNVKS